MPTRNPNPDQSGFHLARRVVVALIGVCLCLWLMLGAARVGASRLLSNYSAGTGAIEPADKAINLSPADPENYVGRAVGLLSTNQAKAASTDYERAVSLRPQDYRLWMELGNVRDQTGDTPGAVAAFKQAIVLAPFYAQTHWQLGNLLLRAGRYDEALSELRQAAIRRPLFAPQVIDLTWGIYQGDARAVEAVIQPQTSAAQVALAVYFAQRGKGGDALRLFREARSVSEGERRSLLTALLSSKQFQQAHEVWAASHPSMSKPTNSSGELQRLVDGSFESEIGLDDPGFGWQIIQNEGPNAQLVQLSLDSAEPSAGARSLMIKWSGDSPPAREVISQIILVEPLKHYQLSFESRSNNLVTAGPPVITVTDATEQGEKLGQSAALAQGTNGWQKFSVTFETKETTRAIRVAVARQHCSMAICPIFGQTWFDNFILR